MRYRFFLRLWAGGSLNILLNKSKNLLRYKTEYEEFKFQGSVIVAVLYLACALVPLKTLDVIASSSACYLYISLTLRETILRMNGSRIVFFWIFHHYLSIIGFLSIATWDSGPVYWKIRPVITLSCVFMLGVNIVQYMYQKSRLYILRCMGLAKSTDVTNLDTPVGKKRMLWSFVPLLFALYALEMHCGVKLMEAFAEEMALVNGAEWTATGVITCFNPLVAGLILVFLAVGNGLTLSVVLWRKLWTPTSRTKVE